MRALVLSNFQMVSKISGCIFLSNVCVKKAGVMLNRIVSYIYQTTVLSETTDKGFRVINICLTFCMDWLSSLSHSIWVYKKPCKVLSFNIKEGPERSNYFQGTYCYKKSFNKCIISKYRFEKMLNIKLGNLHTSTA